MEKIEKKEDIEDMFTASKATVYVKNQATINKILAEDSNANVSDELKFVIK